MPRSFTGCLSWACFKRRSESSDGAALGHHPIRRLARPAAAFADTQTLPKAIPAFWPNAIARAKSVRQPETTSEPRPSYELDDEDGVACFRVATNCLIMLEVLTGVHRARENKCLEVPVLSFEIYPTGY